MALIGMSKEDKRNDIEVLNRDLFFEHRGVWAYGFAATRLSKSEVGQAVLALGLENRADHQKHEEMLINAINDLGGTPVEMENQYDVSEYMSRREGDIDSDVNIAKLALGLEVDASLGYISEISNLKSPTLQALVAGIAAVEAIHAARIRLAFNALGIRVPVIPSGIVSTNTRDSWVIKVGEEETAHP
jgi:ferritin-like protein